MQTHLRAHLAAAVQADVVVVVAAVAAARRVCEELYEDVKSKVTHEQRSYLRIDFKSSSSSDDGLRGLSHQFSLSFSFFFGIFAHRSNKT